MKRCSSQRQAVHASIEEEPPEKMGKSSTEERAVQVSIKDEPPEEMENSFFELQAVHGHIKDDPPEEMQDQSTGNEEMQDQSTDSETATEGESDVDYVAESDHSPSSSSSSDLPTGDGEDTNDPAMEWTSKSGQVWFSTNAQTTRYFPSARGVTPGLTKYAISRIHDVVSTFDLFFTPKIINTIVNMTNVNGKYSVPRWHNIDATDVRAYIGLLILTGVYRSKAESTRSLWDDHTGRAIFRATMSLTKFNLISSTLRFNDRRKKPDNLSKDKLAPIRTIWDMWTQCLPLFFNPGTEVCVGEQFVPFRGRCGFTQYLPKKMEKYGLKIFVTADVPTSYAWKCQIFTGKAADKTEEVSQRERVVLDMTDRLQGVTVTCNNYFTTYSLAEELLKRKMALIGAIKKTKPEVPPKLLHQSGRTIQSSVFAFTKTTTLVSYVPKRGKNMIFLSTKHRNKTLSNHQKKQPLIIIDYNRCMEGANNFDKAVRTYTCRKKTSRWPQVLFFNMIDVSAFNSFVLFTAVKPNWKSGKTQKRRLFLEELGKNLVSAEIMRRVHLPSTPSAAAMVQVVQAAAAAADPKVGCQASDSSSSKKRGQCWLCPSKRKRSDTRCIKCGKCTCKDHRVPCCKSCWKD